MKPGEREPVAALDADGAEMTAPGARGCRA